MRRLMIPSPSQQRDAHSCVHVRSFTANPPRPSAALLFFRLARDGNAFELGILALSRTRCEISGEMLHAHANDAPTIWENILVG